MIDNLNPFPPQVLTLECPRDSSRQPSNSWCLPTLWRKAAANTSTWFKQLFLFSQFSWLLAVQLHFFKGP